MKKTKTLGRFLIKKYITTSLLLLVLGMTLTTILQFFISGSNGAAVYLCANEIVRSDYKSIDIKTLEDVGGWLEILDEENNVIYTKGKVKIKRSHYTQNQLLEMDALQSIMTQKIYRIGPITVEPSNQKPRYMATFAPFTGADGRSYICIAKMPQKSVRGSFMLVFDHIFSQTSVSMLKLLPYILIPLLLIFIFCLRRYSKTVKEHIIAPNTTLIDGLRSVKNGNYSKKIHMNAEYEYIEIEQSFNHMANQLKEAEEQRIFYEKERQLLFANMAHDLRTPITTIKGSAKAIADGLIKGEKLNQTMETILAKTDHMNELVNRLLIFAKLESPDYQLQIQKLDVSELVREVLLEHLDFSEQHGINLVFNLPEKPLVVSADAVELRRVFDNLIGNSIQHNSAGTTVQINLYDLGQQVFFEVIDNGDKIPRELQEYLFDPFVSGDLSRSTKGGSGLGLAISKKIVTKHGGSLSFIEVDQQEKKFQVSLRN